MTAFLSEIGLPMRWFRDESWQFIGVAIAIIAILISITPPPWPTVLAIGSVLLVVFASVFLIKTSNDTTLAISIWKTTNRFFSRLETLPKALQFITIALIASSILLPFWAFLRSLPSQPQNNSDGIAGVFSPQPLKAIELTNLVCPSPAVLDSSVNPERLSDIEISALQKVKHLVKTEYEIGGGLLAYLRTQSFLIPAAYMIINEYRITNSGNSDESIVLRAHANVKIKSFNINKKVNVITFSTGCGAGLLERTFPSIILEQNHEEKVFQLMYDDASLSHFTLAKGETEVFKFIIGCKEPGLYSVAISIPYSQGANLGDYTLMPETFMACPDQSIWWNVSVQGGELNTVLYCENRQNPAYYRYGRATTPS